LHTCVSPACRSLCSAFPAKTQAPGLTLSTDVSWAISREHRLPTCLTGRKYHPEIIACRGHKVAPGISKRYLKFCLHGCNCRAEETHALQHREQHRRPENSPQSSPGPFRSPVHPVSGPHPQTLRQQAAELHQQHQSIGAPAQATAESLCRAPQTLETVHEGESGVQRPSAPQHTSYRDFNS